MGNGYRFNVAYKGNIFSPLILKQYGSRKRQKSYTKYLKRNSLNLKGMKFR